MPGIGINAVAHDELTFSDLVGLRRLFDAEYLGDFGEWDPGMPYGYAPHDIHVFAHAHGGTYAGAELLYSKRCYSLIREPLEERTRGGNEVVF